jgi:stage II sporulation protein D
MQKVLLFVILQIILSFALPAQSIKISVFNSTEINSLTVNVIQGKYILKRTNEVLGEYKKGSIFYLRRFGNTFEVRDKHNFVGNFNELEISNISGDGIIKVNPLNEETEGREYDGDLIVKAKENRLLLINKLDMEKYIAAVIEAESGNSAGIEFYKAQAVLVRTFTIKNLYKHAEEGFDLCDAVHCQAYKRRCSQHPEILAATQGTAGIVLTDQEGILIMSPFHSNCGGTTSVSGMVWQKDLPYLKPVSDPFCSAGHYSNWTASVSKEDWLHFIDGYTQNNIDYRNYNFSFGSPQRTKIVQIHGIELSMRAVREYFNLKSAFFSINDDGTTITFIGKGYGHGVGMCQEGAMEMARVGYSWLDIIHFYFQDIVVADYRQMELHRFKPEL